METRSMPLYAVTVAKGGPKLQSFQEGSCTPRPRPDLNLLTPPPPAPQPLPGQKYCEWGRRMNGMDETQVIAAEGVTIDQFSKSWLNGLEGRQVVDRTGLTGKFHISLEFAMDDETRRR